MNTKIALSILLWKPERPFDMLGVACLAYYFQKVWPTKKLPAYLKPASERNVNGQCVKLYDQLYDMALTRVAERLDSVTEVNARFHGSLQ